MPRVAALSSRQRLRPAALSQVAESSEVLLPSGFFVDSMRVTGAQRRALKAAQQQGGNGTDGGATNSTSSAGVGLTYKPGGVSNATGQQSELLSALLTNYDKTSFPFPADGGPVVVEINVAMHTIGSINLQEGSMDLNVWFRLHWSDPRLAWNESEWGISRLYVLNQELRYMDIWYPDVTLWNSAYDVASTLGAQAPIIHSTGEVFWGRNGQLRVACNFKGLAAFPFGDVKCLMEIGTWSHGPLSVVVKEAPQGGVTIAGNSVTDMRGAKAVEWKFRSVRSWVHLYPAYPCCPEESNWPVVLVDVTLQRTQTLFALKILVPQIVLALVGFMTFWLSPECGERLGVAVTIPLALAVYDLLVYSTLPASDDISCIGAIGLLGFLFSVVTLAINGAVVHLFHYREPRWWMGSGTIWAIWLRFRQQRVWGQLLEVLDTLETELIKQHLKENQAAKRARQPKQRRRSFLIGEGWGRPSKPTGPVPDAELEAVKRAITAVAAAEAEAALPESHADDDEEAAGALATLTPADTEVAMSGNALYGAPDDTGAESKRMSAAGRGIRRLSNFFSHTTEMAKAFGHAAAASDNGLPSPRQASTKRTDPGIAADVSGHSFAITEGEAPGSRRASVTASRWGKSAGLSRLQLAPKGGNEVERSSSPARLKSVTGAQRIGSVTISNRSMAGVVMLAQQQRQLLGLAQQQALLGSGGSGQLSPWALQTATSGGLEIRYSVSGSGGLMPDGRRGSAPSGRRNHLVGASAKRLSKGDSLGGSRRHTLKRGDSLLSSKRSQLQGTSFQRGSRKQSLLRGESTASSAAAGGSSRRLKKGDSITKSRRHQLKGDSVKRRSQRHDGGSRTTSDDGSHIMGERVSYSGGRVSGFGRVSGSGNKKRGSKSNSSASETEEEEDSSVGLEGSLPLGRGFTAANIQDTIQEAEEEGLDVSQYRGQAVGVAEVSVSVDGTIERQSSSSYLGPFTMPGADGPSGPERASPGGAFGLGAGLMERTSVRSDRTSAGRMSANGLGERMSPPGPSSSGMLRAERPSVGSFRTSGDGDKRSSGDGDSKRNSADGSKRTTPLPPVAPSQASASEGDPDGLDRGLKGRTSITTRSRTKRDPLEAAAEEWGARDGWEEAVAAVRTSAASVDSQDGAAAGPGRPSGGRASVPSFALKGPPNIARGVAVAASPLVHSYNPNAVPVMPAGAFANRAPLDDPALEAAAEFWLASQQVNNGVPVSGSGGASTSAGGASTSLANHPSWRAPSRFRRESHRHGALSGSGIAGVGAAGGSGLTSPLTSSSRLHMMPSLGAATATAAGLTASSNVPTTNSPPADGKLAPPPTTATARQAASSGVDVSSPGAVAITIASETEARAPGNTSHSDIPSPTGPTAHITRVVSPHRVPTEAAGHPPAPPPAERQSRRRRMSGISLGVMPRPMPAHADSGYSGHSHSNRAGGSPEHAFSGGEAGTRHISEANRVSSGRDRDRQIEHVSSSGRTAGNTSGRNLGYVSGSGRQLGGTSGSGRQLGGASNKSLNVAIGVSGGNGAPGGAHMHDGYNDLEAGFGDPFRNRVTGGLSDEPNGWGERPSGAPRGSGPEGADEPEFEPLEGEWEVEKELTLDAVLRCETPELLETYLQMILDNPSSELVAIRERVANAVNMFGMEDLVLRLFPLVGRPSPDAQAAAALYSYGVATGTTRRGVVRGGKKLGQSRHIQTAQASVGAKAEFHLLIGDEYNHKWRLLSSFIDANCRYLMPIAYVFCFLMIIWANVWANTELQEGPSPESSALAYQ
ncbi:hypothetical protein HYH03_006476 [Edaphochlamys debaryana]|uniref:Uncharacterized protein n=1 Tax=Edaphochlamys debaryana TaxID=47281 RepID=A0A835Y6B3_9CHLO|nr:hypothetical protein HYH03_006476 [Edaphochlamys debaryana]|eukprot:KAG2495533.1 hypothetical protein HYH03_006476 [Edaphochlamys debaryana]